MMDLLWGVRQKEESKLVSGFWMEQECIKMQEGIKTSCLTVSEWLSCETLMGNYQPAVQGANAVLRASLRWSHTGNGHHNTDAFPDTGRAVSS